MVFSLSSHMQFVLKLSSIVAKVQALTFAIKYPKTPLGLTVEQRHPNTMIVSSAIEVSDSVIDLTFEKVLLLASLGCSLKAIFSKPSTRSPRTSQTPTESSSTPTPTPTNRPKLSLEPTDSSKTLPSSTASPDTALSPATSSEFIEAQRFLFNFQTKFDLERFILLYELPEKNASLSFSLDCLSMKFQRTILVTTVKNVVFGLIAESNKNGFEKNSNDDILSLPIVS